VYEWLIININGALLAETTQKAALDLAVVLEVLPRPEGPP
jgi:hypothetical protein